MKIVFSKEIAARVAAAYGSSYPETVPGKDGPEPNPMSLEDYAKSQIVSQVANMVAAYEGNKASKEIAEELMKTG